MLILFFLVKISLILATFSDSEPSSPSSRDIDQKEKMVMKRSGDERDTLLKKVEMSLFGALGMTARPLSRQKIFIPDFMVNLFHQQERIQQLYYVGTINKRSAGVANTVRTSIHSETPLDALYPEGKFRFKFELNIPSSEILTAAFLHLYAGPSSQPRDRHIVKVYDILKTSTRSSPDAITRLLDIQMVDEAKSGWIELDVYPSVSRWIENERKNFGLYVKVHSMANSTRNRIQLRKNSENFSANPKNTYDPFLVTFTKDQKFRIRTKRASRRRHKQKKRHESCRRHNFYIDFQEVGWNDWIVTPPGFHAYYCEGECNFPLANHLNTTNHAIVQTIVNNINPNLVPRSCCVPTQLAPISMLYVDEYDKVVLKNYQEMVVEGCGCR